MPNGDWTAQQIQIPIIAWHGGFEIMKQTGCNIVGGVAHSIYDLDWWTQLAQTAQQYKIGIMPWAGQALEKFLDEPGWKIRPEWETFLSNLGGEPSLYGFYAWEEPNVLRQLGGWGGCDMTEIYETIKRLAPKAKVTG
ncbi:unnamed protein product, partial [marine sediment metagenome]